MEPFLDYRGAEDFIDFLSKEVHTSMFAYSLLLLALTLEKSAGIPAKTNLPPASPAVTTASILRLAPEMDEPLFEGMGKHHRTITTSSLQAQKYFDQGLNFLFAFNHDEAIRSFKRATMLDPHCAMAWWGIAIANGPHINNPMVDTAHAEAAWRALEQAKANSAQASAVEQALIEAAQARYANPQPDDRKALDTTYAEAMRGVWKRFPKDTDVGALFAEAMMDLRPWDLWMPDGTPQPGTPEVVATLEEVLKQNPMHPQALHLYIHAMEASPQPQKALPAADRLRNLMPGLGHMVHMPSHIDVRTGRWKEAVVANERAMEVDRKYRQQRPKQGFYRLYMLHNHHMLAYAAIMRGESEKAIKAVDTMIASVPAEWAKENAVIADGFVAMPVEMRIRFGKWEEVLAAPEPPTYFPLARALWRSSRGIAYAAQGKIAEARSEQAAFSDAAKLIPPEAFFGNNPSSALVELAKHMLEGEILVREKKLDAGIEELRKAVQCEDALHYDEPPSWILPVRHALGATLIQAGRYAEAEKVYRDDLAKLPENGWSLYGLSRCLAEQGKQPEATKMMARFQRTWTNADMKLTSSCFCQPGKEMKVGKK